jgi:hypothetical protein
MHGSAHDGEDSARNAAHEATFMQKMRMLSGYPIGCALRFAVDLDLATILVDGPCTIEDLAVFTETDRGVLERNIRRLESVGVFRVYGSTVEVTELGASLAREGGAESAAEQPYLAERTCLPEQLPKRPEPAHAPGADDSVPINAIDDGVRTDDAVVISSVLNDWTHDDFNRILSTLCAATPPGGRLVLIELVLPPDGVVERVGETDPLMVAQLGGRGHTAAEWTAVLAANGFRLERIRPGAPPFSFIDAIRQ